MLGEPTKAERAKIEKRIRVVSAWKKQTGGEPFPEWMDLDEMAKGTADVGNGVPDLDAMSYFQRQKQTWRGGSRKLTDAEQRVSLTRHRMAMVLAAKERSGGIVGLVLTGAMRVRCTYQGVQRGIYMTYREAAQVYDRLAREHEGKDAITNEPAAVAREDKKLKVEQERRKVKMLRRRKKVRA